MAAPTCQELDIERCITEFLLTLSAPELSSFKAALQAILTVADIVRQLLIAQLEQANVLKTIYEAVLAPITAAQDVLLAVLGGLPLTRIPDCVGLADYVALVRSIVRQFSPRFIVVEDFLNELDIRIAVIEKRIADITDFTEFTDSLINCIDQVLLYVEQNA